MNAIPRFSPSLQIRDIIQGLLDREAEDPLVLFCREFADFIGVRHAIPAPSARAGLAALVRALGFRTGAEVLIPGLTFHSVPAVFRAAGFACRFVDIREDTYCLDPDRIAQAVGPRTAAIVPVHLYGRACEMDRVLRLANEKGLTVIEDCAQGCGAATAGRRVGSWGRAGIFSFHVAKNLAALNFGMVTTDDPDLAGRVQRALSNIPRVGRPELSSTALFAAAMDLVTRRWFWQTFAAPVLRLCAELGKDPIEALTSERPDGTPGVLGASPRPLQARIARRILRRVDEENSLRRRNAECLREALQEVPRIGLPAPSSERENIYLSFVVRVDDRERFRRALMRRGVDTHPGNMSVGPEIPGFAGSGECPVSSRTARRLVHLPIHARLDHEDIRRIAEAVKEVLR